MYWSWHNYTNYLSTEIIIACTYSVRSDLESLLNQSCIISSPDSSTSWGARCSDSAPCPAGVRRLFLSFQAWYTLSLRWNSSRHASSRSISVHWGVNVCVCVCVCVFVCVCVYGNCYFLWIGCTVQIIPRITRYRNIPPLHTHMSHTMY